MIELLKREQFEQLVRRINSHSSFDMDFLYETYDTVINGLKDMEGLNNIGINQYEIISYIVGEYSYTTFSYSKEQLEAFTSKENNIISMASLVADKYLSLSMFNFSEQKLMDRFLPPISTLNLYLNFMLNILNGFNKNEPLTTLVSDLLDKSISISRCVLSLLVDGYVTEAFATWRTLHEC